MNQSPTVSVVIPNYNYGRFVAETIESALAQTVPVDEIVVVDDGSTDDSVEVVKRFGGKVRLISQRNEGVGAARNAGVANTSGEFVAFLDADDIWMPAKIEEQLKLFADESVVLVSGGVREFDSKTGETIEIRVPQKTLWSAEVILRRRDSINVAGHSIVVRREAFEKSGGFDNRKELHPAEDWEFCYRMALAGAVVSVPKILVDYRNHGGNGHLNPARMERATILAYEKIFAAASPETLRLRRDCYANLHTILAGEYFQAGKYFSFARQMLKGLQAEPSSIVRYLGFPLRVVKRLTAPQTGNR